MILLGQVGTCQGPTCGAGQVIGLAVLEDDRAEALDCRNLLPPVLIWAFGMRADVCPNSALNHSVHKISPNTL
jgi:hypothetical protein